MRAQTARRLRKLAIRATEGQESALLTVGVRPRGGQFTQIKKVWSGWKRGYRYYKQLYRADGDFRRRAQTLFRKENMR